MKRLILSLGVLAGFGSMLSTAAANAQVTANPEQLRVYFIDVEGGQATLFVTPSGQSLLIDTGWPGDCTVDQAMHIVCGKTPARDADRIVAVAKKGGLTKIDYVLITHYHVDHAGGIPALVERIPVRTFLDHGPNRELDKGITEKDYALYQQVLASGKYKNLHPKPGDVLPIDGITARVISSDGALIDKPLAGAGETNSYCKASELRPADQTENSRSLGVEISFGAFRILDLGDLTWDKEMQLMCPVNKLGKVDVLVVSHHGWYQSSSPALIDAIGARVAIMDNGALKGGSTPVLKTIRAAPGLEALWQLHYSEEGGAANNTADELVANPRGPDEGHSIELVARQDGSFSVVNERTGGKKDYKQKK